MTLNEQVARAALQSLYKQFVHGEYDTCTFHNIRKHVAIDAFRNLRHETQVTILRKVLDRMRRIGHVQYANAPHQPALYKITIDGCVLFEGYAVISRKEKRERKRHL